MPTREELIRPRINNRIERLKQLNDLNAPLRIIAAEAWLVLNAIMALGGHDAMSEVIQQEQETQLARMNICVNADCANPPDVSTNPAFPSNGRCAVCNAQDDKDLDEQGFTTELDKL